MILKVASPPQKDASLLFPWQDLTQCSHHEICSCLRCQSSCLPNPRSGNALKIVLDCPRVERTPHAVTIWQNQQPDKAFFSPLFAPVSDVDILPIVCFLLE